MTKKFKDLIQRKDNLWYVKYARIPFTGAVVEFRGDNQLWHRGNYKNGKMHGLWEYYYEDGQLWWKKNYKNGKLDGLWEHYYEDGQLKWKKNYKDGESD